MGARSRSRNQPSVWRNCGGLPVGPQFLLVVDDVDVIHVGSRAENQRHVRAFPSASVWYQMLRRSTTRSQGSVKSRCVQYLTCPVMFFCYLGQCGKTVEDDRERATKKEIGISEAWCLVV